MNCSEAEVLIHALIDGELDAGHVRNVEAHQVIKSTMEGKVAKVPKLKPKDIAAYLLNAAQTQPSQG